MEETRGEVAEGYPGVAVFIQRLDVAEEASIESFYSAAIAQFGRIDFVANVAGYAHPAKPVNELTLDHYERSYMVNIRGVSSNRTRYLYRPAADVRDTDFHERTGRVKADAETRPSAGL